MREITPEVMSELIERFKDENPADWPSSPATVYIHEGNLIFQLNDELDAERTLYAMMSIIASDTKALLAAKSAITNELPN